MLGSIMFWMCSCATSWVLGVYCTDPANFRDAILQAFANFLFLCMLAKRVVCAQAKKVANQSSLQQQTSKVPVPEAVQRRDLRYPPPPIPE